MKKSFLFSLICLLLAGNVMFGQIRVAVYNTETSELKTGLSPEVNQLNRQNLRGVADQIVTFYSNDDRFIVIDKAKDYLVKSEQERQKSESFIDGYVVEQGKQEGADYIIYTKFLRKEKSLYMRLYNVESGEIECQATEEVDMIMGIVKNTREKVTKLLNQINSECFSLSFQVMRSLDKKQSSKTKNVLIAAGKNQNMKEGYELEIFKVVIEKVGNKELKRTEIIAEGKIEDVEDANFSNMKISKGGDQVANSLNKGEELFCRMK